MKTVQGLTGLMAALVINVQAISITNITVLGADDPNGSNVTVTAYFTGASSESRAELIVYSSNGLFKQSFMPESAVTSNTWTETRWNPNFTGDYIVKVNASDPHSGSTENSTTVTVTRTVYGPFNSVQVAPTGGAYDPNGPWTNMDVSQVILDLDNSSMTSAITMIGFFCDLQNVNYTITTNMTDEQREKAHIDTSAYQPAGTPFRFDMVLHQRPTSLMAMGELKRFVWMPNSTNNPDGRGQLVFDITSCSPWRSSHTSNVPAYVGFNTVYMTASNAAALARGVLLHTSAHCQDVEPFITEDCRVGLHMNGHSSATNYLTVFIPDTQLPNFGVTNVDMATNMLTGYVTHYNTNGTSEGDTAAVETEFTRITGGTNLVYDYNADGAGDSGYEVRFSFTFHSQVDAQVGPTGLAPVVTSYAWVKGDFDGDGKADPTLYIAAEGTWQILLSAVSYSPVVLTNFGGTGWTATAGDFDGDGKADPAIYNATSNTLIVQLSASGYAQASATGLGGSGYAAIQGDFDGDGKADPALYNSATGDWLVKLSASGYPTATLSGFGGSGSSEAVGDFDGDGKADPAVYEASTGTLSVKLSNSGYATASATLGGSGSIPVSGDFDGDGKADPAVYETATGNWTILLSGNGYTTASLTNFGGSGYSLVEGGDFDGDGKADPAVIDNTGVLSVKLSSMGYTTATLPLTP